VELVIKSGEGMFKGKINAACTKMTGHLIQGKRSIRVTLRRADPNAGATPVTALQEAPSRN
jgi:hypothetical protein